MRIRILFFFLLTGAHFAFLSSGWCDVFGTGNNAFEIEFVTIGAPGNVADTSGVPNPVGAVPYNYRIAKYEISEEIISKANAVTAGDPFPLGIVTNQRGPNKPATNVSWIEAVRFVNWLNISSGYQPAYKFIDLANAPPPNRQLHGFAMWEPGDPGYDPDNLYRNQLARYFLPSMDEWYKAAYFNSDDATYSQFANWQNSPPAAVASGTQPNTVVYDQLASTQPADIDNAGSLSPSGIMALGGNVDEWQETESDNVNDDILAQRSFRGGYWDSGIDDISSQSIGAASPLPGARHSFLGFRVASVPEPRSCTLLLCSVAAFMTILRS